MYKGIERLAQIVTIAGCVTGSAYLLTTNNITRTANAQTTEQDLSDRIAQLLTLQTREILGERFTQVTYDNRKEKDNLQNILEEERTPAIVLFYEETGNADGVEASKKLAVALREIVQTTKFPVRFIAFSYNIIPKVENERARYFVDFLNIRAIPTIRMYSPQNNNAAITPVDTRRGGIDRIEDISTVISELSEYWLIPNLFQTGPRTVYRFEGGKVWLERRADGRGNILDAQGNVVGQDVDPELVRMWNELRSERTVQQAQSSSQ